MKKYIISVGVFLLLVLAFNLFLNKKPVTNQYTVTRQTLDNSLSASGEILLAAQTEVYSTTNGILSEVYVTNGQTVAKGDPLFKVESTATDQDVAAAWGTYQNALSALKTAQQTKESADASMWLKQKAVLDAQNNVDYKNDNTTNPATKKDYTDLEKKSLDSALIQARKDFAAVEKTYTEADIAIGAAQANVNAKWLDYQATQDSKITAPASGTIIDFLVNSGFSVTAKSDDGGNKSASNSDADNVEPVLKITSATHTIYAKIRINESDINRLTIGQNATLTPEQYPDLIFRGTVEKLSQIGENVDGVTTYYAYVTIQDRDDALKSGMNIDAMFKIGKKENVLIVPVTSITLENGKTCVLDAKNRSCIEVKTGVKNQTQVEVTDGLREGVVILTDALLKQ